MRIGKLLVGVGTLGCLLYGLGILAFWIGIAYVVLHFILKFW